MKTIQDHRKWAEELLTSRGLQDARLSSQILLSHVSGRSKEDLIRNPEVEISNAQSVEFQSLVQRRAEDIPLSYLTKEKEFYSLKFYVDENVLIPRPETELLIQWFGEKIGNREVSVCDFGTGSGVIAITHKKLFPKLNVTAIDISLSALHIAKKNAQFHNVDIEWRCTDIAEYHPDSLCDILVSNPPYIPSATVAALSKTVQYEPKLALDGGSDGLDVYRKIFIATEKCLKPGGDIFLEFGERQKEDLVSLCMSTLVDIETRNDYAGNDRILHAKSAQRHRCFSALER